MVKQTRSSNKLITDDGEFITPLSSPKSFTIPTFLKYIAGVLFLIPFGLVTAFWLCDHVVADVDAAIFLIPLLGLIVLILHFPPLKAQFDRVTFPFREIEDTRNKKRKHGNNQFALLPEDSGVSSAAQEGIFLLYPQHSGRLMGRSKFVRKYAYNGEMRFVYSILIPLLGILTAFLLLWPWSMIKLAIQAEIQIPRIGVTTNATVKSCNTAGNNSRIDVSINYQPTTKDLPIDGYISYFDRDCAQVPIGSAIPIWYLAPFPDQMGQRQQKQSSDESQWSGPLYELCCSVPVAIVMIPIGILLRAISSDLRFRYLRRNGTTIIGRFIGSSVEQGRTSKSGRHTDVVVLKYRFPTPDDREITTSQSVPEEVWGQRRIPDIGTSVAVLYADDANFKLL